MCYLSPRDVLAFSYVGSTNSLHARLTTQQNIDIAPGRRYLLVAEHPQHGFKASCSLTPCMAAVYSSARAAEPGEQLQQQ